ncbi:MAG: CoA transferase, partial [Chloroflexi bacterium]|nr:CoA transferase [Chloroflexota bacterium]
MPPSIPLPLSPYRVLDLTNERGWLCARMLGDMGADVIKVEPPGGDTGRRFGPFYRGEAHREKSIPFWAWNANKRSVTLDLTTADGQALFRQLVSLSDFVVESLGRGHLDNLGLGYEALAALNPSVILTSITPYGPEGPKRDWASV